MLDNPNDYLLGLNTGKSKRLGYDFKYFIRKNNDSEVKIIKNSPIEGERRDPKTDFDSFSALQVLNTWDKINWGKIILRDRQILSPIKAMEAIEITFNLISILKPSSSQTKSPLLRMYEHGIRQIRQNVLFVQEERLWNKFDKVVEKTFGKYMKSKVIERLIQEYVKSPKYVSIVDFSQKQKTKNVNITVNYLSWSNFIETIKGEFGKTKIQSQVIHSILTHIMKGRTIDEIADLLRGIYYSERGLYLKDAQGKPISSSEQIFEVIKPIDLEERQFDHDNELIRRLASILNVSTGKIPLDTIYQMLDVKDDVIFLELIYWLKPENVRIDWDKRQLKIT